MLINKEQIFNSTTTRISITFPEEIGSEMSSCITIAVWYFLAI